MVAEEAGRVLGFACAYGREDERWGTLLDNLHVDPECNGIRHVKAAVEFPIESAISFNVGLGGTNSALVLRSIPPC